MVKRAAQSVSVPKHVVGVARVDGREKTKPVRPGAAPITPLHLPRGVTTVVVYGGTFDPPTSLHATVGGIAASMGWDSRRVVVVYVPAARNPLKDRAAAASDEQRVGMLREGLLLPVNRVSSKAAGVVWTDEIDRAAWLRARGTDAPSFMVETIRRLRTLVPAPVTLRLAIGTDQAVQFHRWREHRELEQLAEPLVMLRPPHATPAAFLDAMKALGMRPSHLVAWARRVVPDVAWDTSATRVRAMLPRQSLAYEQWDDGISAMVEPRVAAYIITHRLYGVGTMATTRTAEVKSKKRL